MTNPPPPEWQPPQTGPEDPFGRQPQYGFGPTVPPAGWGQPLAPPKSNGPNYLLIGLAVLLVVAVSVGATLLITRHSGSRSNGDPLSSLDIASENDSSPVSIITEDPTCAPWKPIASTLSKRQQQGWQNRNFSIPASSWTPEELSLHRDMAQAMREAADQTVPLAKLTPHRVVRELYEQAIAYWRAYADSIPNYTELDNNLAGVASDASSAIVSICAAIESGAAQARGPLIPKQSGGAEANVITDPAEPAQFLDSGGDKACNGWISASDQFDTDAAPWRDSDPNVPASQWSAEEKSTMSTMANVMERFADQISGLSATSDNPVLRDFAALSAVYWRAFAKALPTYQVSDNSLSSTAAYAHYLIFNACKASGI